MNIKTMKNVIYNFFKNIFHKKDNIINDENFIDLKEKLIKYGNKDKTYYTIPVRKNQKLNNEQYSTIKSNNPDFKYTNSIFIEFIGYSSKSDDVTAFIQNNSTEIYEFIFINPQICNILKWKFKLKNDKK